MTEFTCSLMDMLYPTELRAAVLWAAIGPLLTSSRHMDYRTSKLLSFQAQARRRRTSQLLS